MLLDGFKDSIQRPPRTLLPVDVLILEDTGQGREKLYSSCLAAGAQVVVLPEAQEKREGEDEMPLPVSLPTDKVYSNVVLGAG